MAYKQLSIEEREIIQAGLWTGKTLAEIARELHRPTSTVSREVGRHRPPIFNRYTPRLAQAQAETNRHKRGREDRLKNETIRKYVVTKLKDGYSPEQISGRLSLDHPKQKISYEAIYEFIYAQFYRKGYGRCLTEDLRVYLKRRHKTRQKKGARKGQRVFKPKGLSIDVRPKVVERRKQIGHWEGDSIESLNHQPGLNSLVERKSGLLLLTKLTAKTALATGNVVTARLGVLPPKLRRTVTVDNGSENQDYGRLKRELNLPCYYAHPYCSGERGTNENTNGLVRWYFPKRTDFATISEAEIKAVETALNNRPRKRLGWRTPLEVFNQYY
jgi:IS30 family transposase